MASKLSRREKGLLYLLLCIAITAGCVCLLILPAMSRNAALKDSLDTAEMQKMEMEIKKNTLEKHLARIEELNRTSDELYGSLFTEGMPSELYDAYLTGIALELGVTPTSLTIHAASAEKPEIYAPAGHILCRGWGRGCGRDGGADVSDRGQRLLRRLCRPGRGV